MKLHLVVRTQQTLLFNNHCKQVHYQTVPFNYETTLYCTIRT